MTSDHNHSTVNERRCQAVTSKGHRCRSKATLYRIYEGDGLEYLCCKTHFQGFTPHSGQQGQQPPKEEV